MSSPEKALHKTVKVFQDHPLNQILQVNVKSQSGER
jgi:hypothetical protein